MSDADEALVRGLPGFEPAEAIEQEAGPDPAVADDPGQKPARSPDTPVVRGGPQFPDLFQRAIAGSSMADLVSVNSPDGSRRIEDDLPPARSRGKAPAMAGAESGIRSAEIGPFIGASARRRRRWGR
jgi:hypothetical protein